MPVKYKKCPRCELNYIPKNEEYCGVCKAELKLAPSPFNDETEDEELDGVLCPQCKLNYITFEESVCAVCREKVDKDEFFVEDEDDEAWRSYLDDEKEEDLPLMDNMEVSLSELEEEEFEENEDMEDFEEDDLDDFDSVEDYSDEDDDLDDMDDEDDEE